MEDAQPEQQGDDKVEEQGPVEAQEAPAQAVPAPETEYNIDDLVFWKRSCSFRNEEWSINHFSETPPYGQWRPTKSWLKAMFIITNK